MFQRMNAYLVSAMLSMISVSATAETCKRPKIMEDPWLHREPCKKLAQPATVRAPQIALRTMPAAIPATIAIPTISQSSNGKSVLLIGDSLGVGLEKLLASYFTSKGYPFSAVVKGGQRIESFSKGKMSEPFQAALAKEPSMVIISLGTNDELCPPAYGPRALKAYTKVLADIRAVGAQVYWIGPPTIPCVDEVDQFGKPTGRIVCPSGKIFPIITSTPNYFDSRMLTIPRGGARDVHPTGSGYRLWATEIARWMSIA